MVLNFGYILVVLAVVVVTDVVVVVVETAVVFDTDVRLVILLVSWAVLVRGVSVVITIAQSVRISNGNSAS